MMDFPIDHDDTLPSPGLIWGRRFPADSGAGAADVDRFAPAPADGWLWLHVNLADNRARDWLAGHEGLPPAVRELLLSPDEHQRTTVETGGIGCVFHDFGRELDRARVSAVRALRIAIAGRLVVTARQYPVRCADIVRDRLQAGACPAGPGAALELLIGAIGGEIADMAQRLGHGLQTAEDAFLDGHAPPGARDLMTMRRRLGQCHHMTAGMRGVFQRLEQDEDLPEALLPVVEKLSQRLQSLDRDIIGYQAQLRQLREEIDLQSEQRTNQNLYVLSIMSVLTLPATFVTGFFGMNTGDLPLVGHHGTFAAALVAVGASGATLGFLRWMGFVRR